MHIKEFPNREEIISLPWFRAFSKSKQTGYNAMSHKQILLFLLTLFALSALFSAPLRFQKVDAVQPDGQRVELYASGDEFHNWLHDKDNYTVMQNDEGHYVYAVRDGESLAPGSWILGKDQPAQKGLEPGLNLSQRLISQKYKRLAHLRDYSNARSPHTGDFNNLVIFIKFADDPDFTTGIAGYVEIFNNPTGNSMKRYFHEASYEQLHVDSSFYPIPNGDVILCYTDTYPRSYFKKYSASNPNGYQDDWERTDREQEMLKRAVIAIESTIPTDLVIDGDGDGFVDNTCFIIKGSPEGWADLLWPHRWVLYAVDAYIHGKRVWDFNFQLETSTLSSGASVLSHEMFHSLGAPDLYRYEDSTIDPVGSWDIMCANLTPPQHMSAWMKYKYGQWLDEVPWITESGTYTLSPVAASSTNNICRIASWKTGESYLLEYRKGYGNYDHNLPGTGLLVYRLDPTIDGNASGPPDELYIYRPNANNSTTNGSLSQAAFSLQSGRTQINESTIPSGITSNDRPGGLNIYEIGEAGQTITFKVKISEMQITHPKGGETWFSGTNKTITWKSKYPTGTVTLEYSTDGGNTWTLLNGNASNSGSFLWTNIPLISTTEAYVKVTHNSVGQSDSNTYPFTILSEVGVPEGTWPPDGADDIPTNPLLTWSSVPGADSYQLQVSADENFDSFVVNALNHPHNQYQLSGLTPFHTYYWRVCSYSDLGVDPFCQDMTFTTGPVSELPQAPALLLPAQGAANLAQPVNFSWSASATAETYELQLARNVYFVPVETVLEGLTQTNTQMGSLEPSTTYFWRVRAQNAAGYSNFSGIRNFSTSSDTAAEDEIVPALVNELRQNRPNPFGGRTSISLSLKEPGREASVQIFDLRGRLVKTLFQGVPASQEMELHWDGRDENGRPCASGIYHYRLRSGDFTQTRKMMLIR